MWSCRQARWIHTDEEVSGGVHEVQVNRMVDPAGRAGQHKAKVEVKFVLNKIEIANIKSVCAINWHKNEGLPIARQNEKNDKTIK